MRASKVVVFKALVTPLPNHPLTQRHTHRVSGSVGLGQNQQLLGGDALVGPESTLRTTDLA